MRNALCSMIFSVTIFSSHVMDRIGKTSRVAKTQISRVPDVSIALASLSLCQKTPKALISTWLLTSYLLTLFFFLLFYFPLGRSEKRPFVPRSQDRRSSFVTASSRRSSLRVESFSVTQDRSSYLDANTLANMISSRWLDSWIVNLTICKTWIADPLHELNIRNKIYIICL